MKSREVNVPLFSGGRELTLDTPSRYAYFDHYMSHIHYPANRSFYTNNYQSAIDAYRTSAARHPEDLVTFEHMLKDSVDKRQRDSITVTGALAKYDAMAYTLEALEFSKRKMLMHIGEELVK